MQCNLVVRKKKLKKIATTHAIPTHSHAHTDSDHTLIANKFYTTWNTQRIHVDIIGGYQTRMPTASHIQSLRVTVEYMRLATKLELALRKICT